MAASKNLKSSVILCGTALSLGMLGTGCPVPVPTSDACLDPAKKYTVVMNNVKVAAFESYTEKNDGTVVLRNGAMDPNPFISQCINARPMPEECQEFYDIVLFQRDDGPGIGDPYLKLNGSVLLNLQGTNPMNDYDCQQIDEALISVEEIDRDPGGVITRMKARAR